MCNEGRGGGGRLAEIGRKRGSCPQRTGGRRGAVGRLMRRYCRVITKLSPESQMSFASEAFSVISLIITLNERSLGHFGNSSIVQSNSTYTSCTPTVFLAAGRMNEKLILFFAFFKLVLLIEER